MSAPLATLLAHLRDPSVEVLVYDNGVLVFFGWVARGKGRYGFVPLVDLEHLSPAPREDEVDRAPRAPRPAEAADDCGYEICE